MIYFNIKNLRFVHNQMTQRELINKTNIRPSTLTAIENNKTKTISIEQIDKLCEVFDCQPAELMTYIPNGASPMPDDMLMKAMYQHEVSKRNQQIAQLQNKIKELQNEQKLLTQEDNKPSK